MGLKLGWKCFEVSFELATLISPIAGIAGPRLQEHLMIQRFSYNLLPTPSTPLRQQQWQHSVHPPGAS